MMASVREMREGGLLGWGVGGLRVRRGQGGRGAVERCITGAAHEHSAQSQSVLEHCAGTAARHYVLLYIRIDLFIFRF